MSVIMATTSRSTSFVHRPYHPLASGDASYSPATLDRYHRSDGHHSRNPRLSSSPLQTRDSEYGTSHAHSHSYVYANPDAPVASDSSQSSASPSPRITRPSLSHQHSTSSLKMGERPSMTFCYTSMTSSWPMTSSSASPLSSSASPPVSRAREEPHLARDAERGREGVRVAGAPLSALQHRPQTSPLRPSATIRPRPDQALEDSRVDAPTISPEGRLHSAVFTGERYASRARHNSYSPENVRPSLPPLPIPELRRSMFPEFIQGSSRPSFSNERRWGTASPPPSPSPSASSFSTTDAPSVGGHTDTEPTDEDDYVKSEHESVELPPLRFPRAIASSEWHSQKPILYSPPSHHAFGSPVHRDALSPLLRSMAASPLSSAGDTSTRASARASPDSPFQRRIEVDVFPAVASDLRSSIPYAHAHAHEQARPPLSVRSTWRVQQIQQHDPAAAPRGRPVQPQHAQSNVPVAAPVIDPALMPLTPKKYRFVASKPVGAAGEWQDEEIVERGRPVTASAGAAAAAAAPSGTKRRYTVSPDSRIDALLSHHANQSEVEDESEGPRKRGRSRQPQPYDVGSFPASVVVSPTPTSTSAVGGQSARFVRAPRGAIVPAYHYDNERAHQCAFVGCGTTLTGKKSETASHMRSHFLRVSGETLECPWPVEGEDGGQVRCGMAFKDSANFGRHVSSKHIKAEEYQCNRCGRPFARRDAALRHMKTLCRTDGPGARRKADKKAVSVGKEELEEGYMYDD